MKLTILLICLLAFGLFCEPPITNQPPPQNTNQKVTMLCFGCQALYGSRLTTKGQVVAISGGIGYPCHTPDNIFTGNCYDFTLSFPPDYFDCDVTEERKDSFGQWLIDTNASGCVGNTITDPEFNWITVTP